MKINLNKYNDVKEFIKLAQNSEAEIALKSGKYIVDGKSILGIFSLDLSQDLIIESEDEEFLNNVKIFEV